jgi:hypothetical protein
MYPNYPVVFAACDDKYFIDHAPAFIASTNAAGKDTHIHVLNMTDAGRAMFAQIKSRVDIKLTLSESSVPKTNNHDEYRTYCACSRFIALPDLLQRAGQVLTLDIDCLVMKDFDVPDKPIGYFPREPIAGTVGWESQGTRVAAGVVYFTLEALDYTKQIRDRIFKGPFRWFLDQIALSEVLGDVDAHHFDNQFMDWEFIEGTTIWTGKGPRKYDNPKYVAKKEEFAKCFQL